MEKKTESDMETGIACKSICGAHGFSDRDKDLEVSRCEGGAGFQAFHGFFTVIE